MKYLYIAIGIIVVLIVGFATIKKVSPVSWGLWGTTNTSSGLAVHGYDAVAYVADGKAIPGTADHSYDWADASWQFSSAANRDAFEADPERYAPRFGGFCSFAVSKGFTADSDPEAWHVENGHLYLFADTNVRDEWVAGLAEGSLAASEANWAKR